MSPTKQTEEMTDSMGRPIIEPIYDFKFLNRSLPLDWKVSTKPKTIKGFRTPSRSKTTRGAYGRSKTI